MKLLYKIKGHFIEDIQGGYTVIELAGQGPYQTFLFFFSPEPCSLELKHHSTINEKNLTKACWGLFLCLLLKTEEHLFSQIDPEIKKSLLEKKILSDGDYQFSTTFDLAILLPFATTSQSVDKSKSVFLGLKIPRFNLEGPLKNNFSIGVDVEHSKRNISKGLLPYFLNNQDHPWCNSEALRAWVIKEASFKYFFKLKYKEQLPLCKIILKNLVIKDIKEVKGPTQFAHEESFFQIQALVSLPFSSFLPEPLWAEVWVKEIFLPDSKDHFLAVAGILGS